MPLTKRTTVSWRSPRRWTLPDRFRDFRDRDSGGSRQLRVLDDTDRREAAVTFEHDIAVLVALGDHRLNVDVAVGSDALNDFGQVGVVGERPDDLGVGRLLEAQLDQARVIEVEIEVLRFDSPGRLLLDSRDGHGLLQSEDAAALCPFHPRCATGVLVALEPNGSIRPAICGHPMQW